MLNNIFTNEEKSKQIVVLGSTGFIGHALVRCMQAHGFSNIICVYRNEHKKSQFYPPETTSSLKFVKGSLDDEYLITECVKNADIVINTAGKARDWGTKKEFLDANFSIPKNIYKIIVGKNSFTQYIYLSSAIVYGMSNSIKNELSPLQISDRYYSWSKCKIHAWLKQQYNKSSLHPITLLAPTIVWGPGDQIYIPGIIQKLKQKMLVYVGKEVKIDFIHIQDLIDAIMLCLFNTKSYNQEFILNGPEPFAWKNYISKIAEFANLPAPKYRIPYFPLLLLSSILEYSSLLLNLFYKKYSPQLTKLQVKLLSLPLQVDASKSFNNLNFKPSINLDKGLKGLREYVNYCR